MKTVMVVTFTTESDVDAAMDALEEASLEGDIAEPFELEIKEKENGKKEKL